MPAIAVFAECEQPLRMKLVKAVHRYFTDANASALKRRLDAPSDYLGLLGFPLADPIAERERNQNLARTLVVLRELGIETRLYRLYDNESLEDVPDLERRGVSASWIEETLGAYEPSLAAQPAAGAEVRELGGASGPVDIPDVLTDLEAWRSAGSGRRAQVIIALGEQLSERFSPEGAALVRCAGLDNHLGAFRHRLTGMLMHLIPGGTFEMGSSPAERARLAALGWEGDAPEVPSAPVTVAPFLLARFPITERPWLQLGGTLSRRLGDDHPIDAVSRDALREWSLGVGRGRLRAVSAWLDGLPRRRGQSGRRAAWRLLPLRLEPAPLCRAGALLARRGCGHDRTAGLQPRGRRGALAGGRSVVSRPGPRRPRPPPLRACSGRGSCCRRRARVPARAVGARARHSCASRRGAARRPPSPRPGR